MKTLRSSGWSTLSGAAGENNLLRPPLGRVDPQRWSGQGLPGRRSEGADTLEGREHGDDQIAGLGGDDDLDGGGDLWDILVYDSAPNGVERRSGRSRSDW